MQTSKINVVTYQQVGLRSAQSYLETGGSQEELVPLDRKMKKGMGVALACSLPAGDVGSGGVDPDAETRRSVSVMEGKGQGAAGT